MKHGLHHIFIHADRARNNVAPGVGHSKSLQKALKRAVLHIRAVNDGERRVYPRDGVVAELFGRVVLDHRFVRPLDGDNALTLCDERVRILIIFDVKKRVARVEKVLLRDVERNDLIFLAGE